MTKVFCKDCRYIEWVPVDGPFMSEPRCKKVKGNNIRFTPIKLNSEQIYCKPHVDNLNNECQYYEEKKNFLIQLFTRLFFWRK